MNNKKTLMGITIITLTCKILGFIKNSVLAYYYGTGTVVDAYVMTFAIGTITCGWIAGLVGNFTPIYKKLEINNSKSAIGFASNTFNWIYLIVVVLFFLLQLFAPVVVKFVAPGFDKETYELTVKFFRSYIISVLFYTGFRFSQEFLNCNKYHLQAIFPDILMSSLCIVAIIVSAYTKREFLIWGYIFAILAEFIIEISVSRNKGFIFQKHLKFDSSIKMLFAMAVPIFMSDTLLQINTLIDKIFASRLDSGTVAAMDYANTMREFAYQIGTIAILTTIYPKLSECRAENRMVEFISTTISSINYMTVWYLPMIAGIFAVGDLIIDIVYRRGQFGRDAALMTTNIFVIYSISLIALAYRAIFLKAFYALQKTKYVFVTSSFNVFFNVFLNFILVPRLGYLGLAIATSTAALLVTPIYFLLYRRTVIMVSFLDFWKVFIKTTVSTICMLIVVLVAKSYFVPKIIDDQCRELMFMLIITMVGAVVFLVIEKLLHVSEVDFFLNIITSKVKLFKKEKKS